MSLFKRGKFWWYEFWFAGRRIQESTRATSKTIAKLAEQKRRRELEVGFNSVEDVRHLQIQTLSQVAKEYLASYALRHKALTFAEYAVGHVTRLLGDRMIVDLDERAVKEYQDYRLREQAAPKSINEEVGFFLRLLGDRGELIRARLKKEKTLKLRGSKSKAKVFSIDEKDRLLGVASEAKSTDIYPVLMLALHAGMRNGEIRNLQWGDVNLAKGFLAVGKSKTEAGEGRTIPLNPDLQVALAEHNRWFELRFGRVEPEWYLFPFGRANKLDPARPITTIKTAWSNVRKRSGISGRLHDSRHTLITERAESGAGDQTIMDIAGHVSRQMLKHYSHIRMKAKRDALETVWRGQNRKAEPEVNPPSSRQDCAPLSNDAPKVEGVSLQKSLQSRKTEGRRKTRKGAKPLKKIGSPGRIRTYNPSVNSRKGVEFSSVPSAYFRYSSSASAQSCRSLVEKRWRFSPVRIIPVRQYAYASD